MAEACAACGARKVTTYRRWAETPVRPVLLGCALATVGYGAVAGGVPWIAGGAVALGGELGVRWWGGRRCHACGDEVMLR